LLRWVTVDETTIRLNSIVSRAFLLSQIHAIDSTRPMVVHRAEDKQCDEPYEKKGEIDDRTGGNYDRSSAGCFEQGAEVAIMSAQAGCIAFDVRIKERSSGEPENPEYEDSD